MLVESSQVLAKAAEEMAYHFEKTYHGCSQAVIRGVLHALGVKEEGFFKAAFPMAGGIGLAQDTCGALLGGMMCLGLCSDAYGRSWDNFNRWGMEQLMDALKRSNEFYNRCKNELGGIVSCREISGMELHTIEDVLKYCETPNFETCCQNCGKIARLVVETLLQEEP